MDNIRLILVGPKYSGNVGACSRVAANFNVSDVWVVAPTCDITDKQARMYGKGPARDILLGIKSCDHLREALKGCVEAVALTRRRGEWHPPEVLVQDLAELSVKSGMGTNQKLAIVFGREDNCLVREEMLLCTRFCEIPTSEVMPTMNLSHSVAAIVSRLYADRVGLTPLEQEPELKKAELGEFEIFMDHLNKTLVDMEFTKGGNPERMHGRMRRVLQRADLSERDLALFRAFFSKVQVKLGTRVNRS